MEERDQGRDKKRTQIDCSLTFKLQLVEEVEKGEETYKQTQRKYGIQGSSTVLNWKKRKPMKGKETLQEISGAWYWRSCSSSKYTRL